MTVSEYLSLKGIEWTRRGDQAICDCPLCSPPDTEKKFAINLTTGLWNCLHTNRCGLKGNFWALQERLGDKPVRLAGEQNFYTPPKRIFKKPQVTFGGLSSPVREFLHKRGLSDKTIEHFKFKSDGEYILAIPFFRAGELVGVKYRDIRDKKNQRCEPDARPTLLNRDGVTGKTLRICEGEMDCAALYEYGIEAVSVPMGAKGFQWIDQEWDYLESFPRIDICFDGDTVGRQAALDLAVRLGEWRCRIVALPLKDADDCLMAGISGSEIDDCFMNAIDVKPSTILGIEDFRDKIIKLFELGQTLWGTKTPWPKLDNGLKGWRPGETTIISGKTGSGKSTMLNQIFLDLIEKDFKICIYSGEMEADRFLRWAVIQYCKKGNPTFEEISNSITWMVGKIYVLVADNNYNQIKPDSLLSDFGYVARRYGVTHFFIDSLMTMAFDETKKWSHQTEFVRSLVGFAKKFGSHIFLVAHPRKTQFDKDEAGNVDIAGSSDITNLAHNVLMLHRVRTDKKENGGFGVPDAVLEILKNREFGTTLKVRLAFNEETKCFSDTDSWSSLKQIADFKSAAGGDDE